MHVDKPHILIVDDDARLRDLISRYTWGQGFVPLAACDASEAFELIKHFEFDAIVLDVMMPGKSGIEMIESLDIPVLLLTALGEVDDKIKGLEAGADDYLTKPFEPKELVLRLNAIIKRTKKQNPFKDLLSEIQLTSSEENLLNVLFKAKGAPISREELAEKCDIQGGARSVDVQIVRLRRKIEEDTKRPKYLKTVRGKGYLLQIS